MTSQQHRELFETVKNWDRWGADDEAGALNLITPELRAAAAAEVVHGHSVSCARELPVEPNAENRHPALHMMVRGGDDCVSPHLNMESTGDFVGVAFHGMATSHIDALCHVFMDRKMYNGYTAATVKSTGATHCSIMVAAEGVVGRGVLLAIPRLRGVEWLDPGDAITADEL